MTANRSILQCPDCGKPLINIGSKVARIHPVARFIRDRYLTIVVSWFVLVAVVVYFAVWEGRESQHELRGLRVGDGSLRGELYLASSFPSLANHRLPLLRIP